MTVLRKTCCVFRFEFLQIGNIEVILESIRIAYACNKLFGLTFFMPDTICLIHTGGYICNNKYSKKAIMWLLHMEQIDGVVIKHARNGLE